LRDGVDMGPHLDDPTDPQVDAILAKGKVVRGRCSGHHEMAIWRNL